MVECTQNQRKEVERKEYWKKKDTNDFILPRRKVKSDLDLKQHHHSIWLYDVGTFIVLCIEAIKGKQEKPQTTKTVQHIVDTLKKLKTYIKHIPPQEQQQRFGNRAFRHWHFLMIYESYILNRELVNKSYLPSFVCIFFYNYTI